MVSCRHRFAAFLALRDHLKAHPPKIWQAVLEQAEAARRAARSPNYGPIVFSLQDRSGSWVVVPYTLAARHFARAASRSRGAGAGGRSVQRWFVAKALRSRISRQAYPHASETIAAANLAVGNPYMLSGYSYGREGSYYEPVLALLPGCLVYVGEEYDPFQERIEVLAEQGVVEARAAPERAGHALPGAVVAGERVLPLRRRATRWWSAIRSGCCWARHWCRSDRPARWRRR